MSNLIGILMKHDENDYSLLHPEIPADDPLLIALLDKYGRCQFPVRGAGEKIQNGLASLLSSGNQHVHLVICYDPDYEYVGCDVFNCFEVALEQFNNRLQEVKAEHPDDPNWVEVLEYDLDKRVLLFRNRNGYEVFYRHEEIQSEAFHVWDCSFCGRSFPEKEFGKHIHRCSLCNRAFCDTCHDSMAGKPDSTSRKQCICLSCELRASIRLLVSTWLLDYTKQMPDSFFDEIYDDVCETSGFNQGEGFNDSDIRLGFARVIARHLGLED